MGTKTLIAVNTVSQIIGKAVTAGVTFFITLLIAHNLGASGYGDFTKITTYVAVFYLFADFGLNAAYIQMKNESHKKNLFSSLVSLRLLGGILLMFLSLAILAFLPQTTLGGFTPLVKIGIILYTPTILLQSLLTTTNAVFQEHLAYNKATLALGIGSVLSLFLIMLSTALFLPEALLTASILSLGLGLLVSVVIGFILVKKYVSWTLLFGQISIILAILKRALPLGLTLLCNVIYFRADSFVLTLTRSTAEVGQYGLAYKFFEFPLVIPTFFMNALFPLLTVSFVQKNSLELQRRVKKAFFLLFFSALLLTGTGFFLAPFLTSIQRDFAQSILPFRILLMGLPIFFMTSLTMWLLVVYRKTAILLAIYGISMIMNILANILLIPRFGITAAATVTVASEFLVLAASCVMIKKLMKAS